MLITLFRRHPASRRNRRQLSRSAPFRRNAVIDGSVGKISHIFVQRAQMGTYLL